MVTQEQYDTLEKEFKDFAYIVSHDMGAPIRQINSFMELFVNSIETPLTDDQKLYHNMMKDCVSKSDEILHCLLEFSRIQTSPEKFTTFTISDALKSPLEDLSERIQASGVNINFKNCDVRVTADQSLIERSLLQILDNSLKFVVSENDIDISVECKKGDDRTVITITDNGIGISEKNLPHATTIFRKFNTKDKYSGSGAGLAYVQKIMRLHGGHVHLRSEIGEGTLVELTIPDT